MREVECMRRLRSGGGSPCFAHTDVWLNNILVPEWPEGGGGGSQQQEVVPTIVDFEFGAIAPTSYDIGHTLGMLVLAAFLVRAYSDGADGGAVPGARRREQEDWLLASVGEAWAEFERVWRGLQQRRSPWRQRAALPPPPLLADALGFAGCTVIRWAIGQFNIFRSLGVGDASGAAHCAAVRRAVHAGAAMLRGRHAIKSTDEVADIARAELA
jgi:5-methylthioribose kinase